MSPALIAFDVQSGSEESIKEKSPAPKKRKREKEKVSDVEGTGSLAEVVCLCFRFKHCFSRSLCIKPGFLIGWAGPFIWDDCLGQFGSEAEGSCLPQCSELPHSGDCPLLCSVLYGIFQQRLNFHIHAQATAPPATPPRKICTATGLPAAYRDPNSILAYASMTAYQVSLFMLDTVGLMDCCLAAFARQGPPLGSKSAL